MANPQQQLARLAVGILTLTRGRLSLRATIGLCLAAVLYVLVLQPLAKQTLGISLPSLPAIDQPADKPAPQSRPAPERTPRSGAGSPTGVPAAVDPADLPTVLTDRGRGVYESSGGLRYTRGSQQGHRLAHVMAHTLDEPDRVGQHGVFDTNDPAEVVRLIDEAYGLALAGKQTTTQREEGRTIYTVNLRRRIGYIGGESGARKGHPSAQYLKLVIDGDRVITAFPLRP
ncbi:hypothetical protein [Botrimarina hoheduenensis]|uniref:Uncharacterized protein n=1 Tax=Botrimarina hoheduenensis TaxID=2528000 RepID=A0A5C5WFP5_9BACT|nr:hypothetical protein [Botrimarina hoheduenensis]TWT48582.1 hypothetical protein Pla111_03560 [Botrimarina hoheduenensis]